MENGPLWTACRTNGYSYGVAFDFDIESNLVLVSINQCSQLTLAYTSAMKTLRNLCEKQSTIDAKRFLAARNLTICMLTEHLATLGRAAGVCLRSYLNNFPIDKYQTLLNNLQLLQYDEEMLWNLIEKYVQPLVTINQSSTLILVNTDKMKETQEYLGKEQKLSSVTLIKDVVKYLSR